MTKNLTVAVNITGSVSAAFTGAIRAVSSQISGLNRSIGSVHARTVGAVNRATAAVGSAGQKIQGAGQSISSTAAPLALLGGAAFNAAFGFEKAGNMLEALGDVTASQRKDFEEFANVLNKKYPQSLKGIIETGNELLKGGFNFDQMKGVIDQTLATAVLGDMKPAEVGNMMARTINSFQLPMKSFQDATNSATKVSDLMTYAAVKTTASLKDMGEMFRYVGGASSAAGISIEKATAFSMAFAKNGTVGSEAGVAMRSAIVRLAKLPKGAVAAMSRIGMNPADYQGKGRKVTSDGIISGLQVDGIDAKGMKGQIDSALNDKALAGNAAKIRAAITKIVQDGMKGSGSAIDASTISNSVNDAFTSASSQIDLGKFFADLKDKLDAGQATLGDVSQILEARHLSRYMALLKTDLAELEKQASSESAGYAQNRYGTVLKGIVGPAYELSAALEKLAVAFGRATFSDIAKGLTAVADGITRLSQANPALLRFATLAGMATIALGPFLILSGGALRVIAPLARGLLLLGAAATTGLAARLASIGAGIAAIAGPRLAAMALGLSMLTRVGAGTTLAALGASLLALGRSVLMFPLVALRAIGLAMAGLLLNPVGIAIAAIVTALTGLGMWVANNWNGLKNFFEGFANGFRDALPASAAKNLDSVVSGLKSIYDTISNFLGPLQATEATWRQWGNSAGKAVGDVVRWIAEIPRTVTMAIGQFASSMGSMAQAGYQAFMAIDWTGLGAAIVNAIIAGIKSMGANLIATLGNLASAAAAKVKGMFGGIGAGQGGGGGGDGLAGKRAAGGPVRTGLPYLVGEKGPEIFMPSSAGKIVANDALRRMGSLSGSRSVPSTNDVRGASKSSVRGGDFSPVFHIAVHAPGGNGDAAKQVQRQVEAVLSRYQSDQRGLLSD